MFAGDSAKRPRRARREFVRPDGDRELHFHLAPDSKEVKLAVSDAVLLGELK